jgi:hypothetical protein
MGRRKTAEEKVLSYKIHARIAPEKYHALIDLLKQTRYGSMSELIRRILEEREIRIVTYDGSLDQIMEVLCSIEKELHAIGVNINQITRQFNSSTSESARVLQSLQVSAEFKKVANKVDALLILISKIASRWLQE